MSTTTMLLRTNASLAWITRQTIIGLLFHRASKYWGIALVIVPGVIYSNLGHTKSNPGISLALSDAWLAA